RSGVRCKRDTEVIPTDLRLCDVTFSSGGVMLAGSIAMPRAGTPSAGVVMVGGSGPSDRNNGTYFPPIRQHFVEAGLTVLCYDKRGVGESSGDWRGSKSMPERAWHPVTCPP
ncbi:MAG TPA: hypothetical protein VIZ20_08530, partial [Streptosporangiaceae bacterium]